MENIKPNPNEQIERLNDTLSDLKKQLVKVEDSEKLANELLGRYEVQLKTATEGGNPVHISGIQQEMGLQKQEWEFCKNKKLKLIKEIQEVELSLQDLSK